MPQQIFNPHAKILHNGQYRIKANQSVSVPVRTFASDHDEELSVQHRIDKMHAEIHELELKIAEKKRISDEQADQMMLQVKDEARKVMEEAEQHAFDRVQQSVDEKEQIIEKATQDAKQIISDSQNEAEIITKSAQKDAIEIKESAYTEGFKNGKQNGYDSGKEDIAFAIERLHSVVAETARERERILVHSENQVINLVLTMVNKVVKKLTSQDKDIVVENMKAALELLRGAMTLFIKVSPRDFNYAVSFKEELVKQIEVNANIKFIEDPTIEPGGVYIETDMGDVDATIRSQLEELETQMNFYAPVKVKSPEMKRREEREKAAEVVKEEESLKQQEREKIEPTSFAERKEYQGTAEDFVDSREDIIPTVEDDIPAEQLEKELQHSTEHDINLNDDEIQADIISDKMPEDDSGSWQEMKDTYKESSDDSEEHTDDDIIV